MASSKTLQAIVEIAGSLSPTLAHYIIEYNPDYSDVIVFEGGVLLKLPVVEAAETSETIPPWRRTE